MTSWAPFRARIRMLVPLWGEPYFAQWLELSAASLMAPGNLPHLQRNSDLELAFLCKSRDVDFLARHPTLREIAARVRVKTITIDEFFPPHGPVNYDVPLTLAYAKGINDLGEDGLGTYVIVMNSDFVPSRGSLAHLLGLIERGFHIVAAPSLRVVDHTARPALRDLLSHEGAERAFAPRTMMSLALRHLHLTVLSRVLNHAHPVEAWHYHQLYWEVAPSCLAARHFLMHPFCFQVRRRIEKVLCQVDYGFISECCPGGRYTVAGDSDDLLIMELQHRDSEANLLDLPPQPPTPGEAMDFRVARVVENAAQWTTAEHRRAFAHDLLFHSGDRPDDCEHQLASFHELVSRIEAQLPPPIPAVRNLHWLGALHAYRERMVAAGLPCDPMLVDDGNNHRFVELTDHGRSAAATLPDQLPGPPGGLPPPSVAAADAAVVVTLDILAREARQAAPEARLLTAALSEAHSPDMATTFLLPDEPAVEADTKLAVYLLTDSIPHWPKFRALCDAALAAGRDAVLVFRDTGWELKAIADRPWILSLLQYHFPVQAYDARFDPVCDPAAAADALAVPLAEIDASRRPCLGFVMRLRARNPSKHPLAPRRAADLHNAAAR